MSTNYEYANTNCRCSCVFDAKLAVYVPSSATKLSTFKLLLTTYFRGQNVRARTISFDALFVELSN